jgi:uncharacterized protein related to proFAR isomerase
MTDVPVKIVVDLSKPKGERESYIPLSQAEIDERDAQIIIAEQERADQQAIADQTALDAQAGRDALVSLGLTEAQITALVGA